MTKNDILEAAEKLFFGKRQSDVKLSSVARVLGIQTPSLYHWFTDKQALLEEVITYSAKNFLRALGTILERENPRETILWYLTFPSETKNLFGIAFQKGFCEDRILRTLVSKYKNDVYTRLMDHFRSHVENDTRIYLLITLLEKLAAENCIDGYCLPKSPDKIAGEVEELFFVK